MSYLKKTIHAPNPECPKCGHNSLYYVFQIERSSRRYDPTIGLHCQNRNCDFEEVDSTSRFESAVEEAETTNVEYKGPPGIDIVITGDGKKMSL